MICTCAAYAYWPFVPLLYKHPELPEQENVYYNGTAQCPFGRVVATTSGMSLLGADEADSDVNAVPLRATPGTQSISGRMQQVRCYSSQSCTCHAYYVIV